MTPLAKAKEVLAALVAYANTNTVVLPALQYTQIGTPVVATEALTIALIDVTPHGQYGPTECNASQLATYTIILSRECTWTSDQAGFDDLPAIEAAEQLLSADSEFLWGFAQNYLAYLSKEWAISFQLTGALGITTMSFIIGVD